MATLEELQPRIGQTVQLQLMRLEQSRVYAKLIGYLVDQAVMVTLPAIAERAWPVREGDAVVCRAFVDGVAFGFQTQALRVAQQPFAHVYLSYPREVESVLVRKTSRVALQREAALLRQSEQGETREPAVLTDLSVTGSCAVAQPGLAAVNDSVTLLLPAGNPDESDLRLSAVVRSARVGESPAGKDPQCQYGLQFLDPTPEQLRVIEKLMTDAAASRTVGHVSAR